MFEYLVQYLQENCPNFETAPQHKERIVLLKEHSADQLLYHVLDVNEAENVLVLLSVYNFNIPEEKRNAMCIFINQLNYDLQEGNFEMDFEDGELRFRSNLVYTEMSKSQIGALLHRLLQQNTDTARSVLPGIAQLIEENVSPFEVYQAIQRA